MAKRFPWARLGDDDLLDVRFCDLGVTLAGTPAAESLERLDSELERRGLHRFRPHRWLSTEWFSPDGVPGIAVPFYLAHPRLIRLERSQMLSAEGASPTHRQRILRHEAGHAIDTAYRLHHRKAWRELFGSFAAPYPQHYKPRPGSRKFVVHLPAWYAQAHPAEDFAETFAVWLAPGSRWRSTYRGWPALRKLAYVDALMKQIGDEPAPVRSRRHVEPLSSDRRTLREHYRAKRLLYGDEFPDFYDADLRKLFSDDPKYAKRPTAASFLRGVRKELRNDASRWAGAHPYTVDQVLRDMIDRCKELKLRLAVPQRKALKEATLMVTVNTAHFLHTGHHPVAL